MKDLTYLKNLINKSNQWILCGEKSFALLDNKDLDSINQHNKYKMIFFKIKLFIRCGLQIAVLYFSQFSLQRKKINLAQDEDIDFIASLEREYRHSNYFRYINLEEKKQYCFIKIFDRRHFTKIDRLPFTRIVRHFYINYRKSIDFLNQEHTNQMFYALMLNVTTNLAIYSYFCALFSSIRIASINASFYSGGGEDLASYAAIQENIPSHHLAHGLIDVYGLNGPIPLITYPEFNSSWVYSNDEAVYLEKHLKETKVNSYPIQAVEKKDKVIIIFMQTKINSSPLALQELEDAINLFLANKYEVLIKAHPESDGEYLEEISTKLSITIISNNNEATSELLNKRNVSFSLAWLSTTHSESLRSGVIPINLNHSWPPQPLALYPYKLRTLSWDKDLTKIKHLISGQENYDAVLKKLLN